MVRRPVGAWLALVALAFQLAFGTAHTAWHFDHLVGALAGFDQESGARNPQPGPFPGGHGSPDIDHCAVGLGLLAGASGIIAGSAPVLVPTRVEPARPQAVSVATATTVPPHLRPPPRAPPVIGISA